MKLINKTQIYTYITFIFMSGVIYYDALPPKQLDPYINQTPLAFDIIYQSPVRKQEYKKITSPYGLRKNPIENTGGLENTQHNGIDLSGVYRAEIVAVADGVVKDHWRPEWKGHDLYGGYIIIQHDDGRKSGYAHLSDSYIHEGQRVSAGETIGRMGNTGKSDGQHLHFILWDKQGRTINPLTMTNIK